LFLMDNCESVELLLQIKIIQFGSTWNSYIENEIY
jgi:hypothetical protein